MKKLLFAMHSRIRASASDNGDLRAQEFGHCTFDDRLNAECISLALPAVVVGTVVGNLKKVAR